MRADASPEAWRFDTSPEAAVADAEFVQENAPERMAVKRELSWCEQTRTDSVVSKPGQSVIGLACSGG
jgi:hypothetical protein